MSYICSSVLNVTGQNAEPLPKLELTTEVDLSSLAVCDASAEAPKAESVVDAIVSQMQKRAGFGTVNDLLNAFLNTSELGFGNA